jgi:hypothetical protein
LLRCRSAVPGTITSRIRDFIAGAGVRSADELADFVDAILNGLPAGAREEWGSTLSDFGAQAMFARSRSDHPTALPF